MAATTRTPQEVFQHHAEVLIAGDIDGIVQDYSDDAVFITPDGALHGKDGVRQGFEKLLSDLPSAELGRADADLRRRRPLHRVEREGGEHARRRTASTRSCSPTA